jgi:FHS family glucose/mannose:H+ symporter-like MFS transporter
MACCACAAACFIGLSLMTGRMAAMALVAATGLSMAGIFAIALVYINEAFPGQSDRTTSILIACGGLGGAFLPKMAGWMLDRFHPAWTVWLIAGWAALLLAIMALISRERLRHREASAANAPF